jgi:hypothetical protein
VHKDVKRRITAVAIEMDCSIGEAEDALMVLGLNMFYNLRNGQTVKPYPVDRAVAEALQRARRGNVVDEESAEQSPEEAARMLGWRISEETCSE